MCSSKQFHWACSFTYKYLYKRNSTAQVSHETSIYPRWTKCKVYCSIGFCEFLETNAKTTLRSTPVMTNQRIDWDEDVFFSCQNKGGNLLYLFGPAILNCRQSMPGDARGSWYTLASQFAYSNRRLGNISTMFPQCIRKDHAYFFYIYLQTKTNSINLVWYVKNVYPTI